MGMHTADAQTAFPLPKPDLRGALSGRAAVVGVGNVLRSDDGLGCRLVERLRERLGQGHSLTLVDAGVSPESHLGPILRQQPDSILFVDAADLGRGPGAFELLAPEDLSLACTSTHDIPLPLLCELARAEAPGVSIRVLAVQPGSTGIGEGLSPEVEGTLAALERQIAEVL